MVVAAVVLLFLFLELDFSSSVPRLFCRRKKNGGNQAWNDFYSIHFLHLCSVQKCLFEPSNYFDLSSFQRKRLLALLVLRKWASLLGRQHYGLIKRFSMKSRSTTRRRWALPGNVLIGGAYFLLLFRYNHQPVPPAYPNLARPHMDYIADSLSFQQADSTGLICIDAINACQNKALECQEV